MDVGGGRMNDRWIDNKMRFNGGPLSKGRKGGKEVNQGSLVDIHIKIK